MHYYSIKIDDDELFNNRSKIPDFVLRSLNSMLNFEVDKLYLQQLKYEMDRTDYPVDYNCFEIGFCGHPTYPNQNIQLEQATNLILSNFH